MTFPSPSRHQSARPGLPSNHLQQVDPRAPNVHRNHHFHRHRPAHSQPVDNPTHQHPDVYQAEQARVRERFESAVELAEQAFATELQRLTAHLAERLTGLHDGQPKVFRDSAVENLREIGKLQITRASHVEPDAEACGTADLCSVGELSRLPDGANTALFALLRRILAHQQTVAKGFDRQSDRDAPLAARCSETFSADELLGLRLYPRLRRSVGRRG